MDRHSTDRSTVPTGRALRVLHLEDSEPDHRLVLAQLKRGGVDVQARRVENEAQFLAALGEPWDAILSDYNLPGYSGTAALEQLRQRDRGVPFILVSGEIGEDTAVEAMRRGASDYLLKQNLARLAPALLHAVEAARAERARRDADRELTLSRQRLRELAQHLQTSVESERAAIAREIHDDVGGSLTALKFDLAWIHRHAGDAVIAERAQQALETVTHAIEASQRVMHNLRPAILEQGLIAALHWMATRFEKRNGIATHFRTSHETLIRPRGVPLVAYRFTQEALTNISKHAHARRALIDLTVADGVLSVEVSDDGRGLDADDLGKHNSFGLRGLHERASTVGGWVDVTSNGAGTTLILSIPLADAEALDHLARTGDDGIGVDENQAHDPSHWGEL
jgi:signal transduction histidine kinase